MSERVSQQDKAAHVLLWHSHYQCANLLFIIRVKTLGLVRVTNFEILHLFPFPVFLKTLYYSKHIQTGQQPATHDSVSKGSSKYTDMDT